MMPPALAGGRFLWYNPNHEKNNCFNGRSRRRQGDIFPHAA